MTLRRRPGAWCAAVSVALLAGCTPDPPPDTVALPPADLQVGVSADLEPFYTQDVAWEPCGNAGRECARVVVPLDYADPSAASIELAVARIPARMAEHRIASLVLNPGGPGVSGVQALTGALSVIGGQVRDVFDVVGFDPRGVGESAAVDCVSDAELDLWRSGGPDPAGTPALAHRTAHAARLVRSCAEEAGGLLPHLDTVSAARDMDVLRAVLGDDRLSYLGASYGTELGATYAEVFPERVGRLVLDAGLDPTMDDPERRLGLAAGFEGALRTYVEHCLAVGPCPFTGHTAPVVETVRGLLEDLDGSPLPTDSDRDLTAPLAAGGILLGVSEERLWPALSDALGAAVRRDDGAPLLFLADAAAGRAADGTYAANAFAASTAFTCLDSARRLDGDGLLEHARRLGEASPTFGRFLLDPSILCSVWPVDPIGDRGPLRAAGAAPILVLGTTGDPAAPYEWSVALAEQIESGRLVTYDGFGHTAYGRSNACVDAAVEGYLLRGEVPPEGLTC